MSNTSEKSAIVTGAAKRVGREIALELAARQYHIGLHFNQSVADAQATRAEIEKFGVRCALLPCDLSDAKSTSELMPEAAKQLPNITVLINNASVYEAKQLAQLTIDDYELNMAVHVRAPLLLTQAFARICQVGNIINIIDMKMVKNNSDYFAYSLSKKALLSLTQLSAKALAPRIRVNAIAPGSTVNAVDEPDPDYMNKRALQVPLKMPGDPKYIIAGVNYLLDNPFVTGDCLYIDGGAHIDVQ